MAGRDILPWNISVVAEDLSQWKKQGINFDSIVVDQRIVIHIRQWPKQAANVFCYKYRLLVINVLMLSMGLRRPLIIWSLIFAQNMSTMTRPGLSTTFKLSPGPIGLQAVPQFHFVKSGEFCIFSTYQTKFIYLCCLLCVCLCN